MVRKALKCLLVAFLLQALLIGPVLAQDFASLVTQASQANQQLVNQVNLALEATDLATLRARTTTAVAAGQRVATLLNAALPLAPDDASRSRISGVLTHINAAIQSGRDALQATDFNTAQSDVNAMRGEAQEALTELAPFAVSVATQTPVATSTRAPTSTSVATSTAVATSTPVATPSPTFTATPTSTPAGKGAVGTPQVAAALPRAGGTPIEPIAIGGVLVMLTGLVLRRWSNHHSDRSDRQFNAD